MFRSLTLTGEQIRAARALGRLEQAELARRSGLSLETIKRLERIRGPVDANSRTLIAIAEAFQAMGIEFETSEGLGVRWIGPSPLAPLRPQRGRTPGAGAVTAPGLLHRLTYHSSVEARAATKMKALLDELGEVSAQRNASLGVTGVLAFCGGRVLQVLEGEKQAVQQLYGAICADPRHTGLQILESRPVPSRQFPDWTLCCGMFASDAEIFRQEPALSDGFRPELLTPASALGLLSMMRDLQRLEPRTMRGVAGPCPLAQVCRDRQCVPTAA